MAVDGSSSFRELDDVFLQSQARIWLGEVLHTIFDEQLSIYDLLSDGELLFEVSKALWNMLLVKYMELKSYKACMFVPVDTRKVIGRYRPYANVDSFLKVCKVMGLSGVDLFSPSDVVEKRGTRKVCVCIRSLSMKARSKQLNVPDFDIVTNTVGMSTDAVRRIRGSLEISSMSGITCGQSKHARLKSRQKKPFASHKEEEEESYLEESDGENSHFSDTSYVDFLYLESGESPDAADKYALTQNIPKSEARNRELDEFAHSPVSILLQYVNSDNELEETLSMCRVWRKLPDDVEASPISRVLDFDFDAKSESDNLTTLESSTYDTMSGLCNQSELQVLEHSADSFSPWWDDTKSCCSVDQDHESLKNKVNKHLGHSSLVSVKDDVTNIADSMQENVEVKELNDYKLMKMADGVFNDPLGVKFSEKYDCCVEDTSKAATKDGRKDDGLVKADANEQNNKRAFNTEKKPSYMAPLLKTVAKGTAVIGILFLLHLRNRSDRNTSQMHWKSSGVGFSKWKGKGSKIYPAEKFKFEVKMTQDLRYTSQQSN